MEQKDRYILLEFLFTFLILIVIIFLFQDVLPGYELYLAPGIIIGFYFSWFVRDKQSAVIRFIINTGIVAVLVWMIYSVANCSWIYRDIILILVKAGILLEIILSFHTWSYSFLGYMQALSLPLFMGFPTFVEDYNNLHAVLVSIYLVCWAVILKLKFYESFNPIREKELKKSHSFFVSTSFFSIIAIISWMLFLFLILGKIEEGGEFLHKQMRYLEDEVSLEKMYYDEQDKIQELIAGMIDNVETKEEREGIIERLNSLVTGTNIAEIKASEEELIDYLKRGGPGLMPSFEPEQLVVLLKDYFDKKIQINLRKIKQKIIYVLKRNQFRFMERIRIISRVDKIRRGKIYLKIRQYAKEIKRTIEDSKRVDQEVKKELEDLAKELKEWKALEIYRQKMEELKNQIVPLDEQVKKQFENLVSDIEKIETATDFKEVEKKIDLMKHTVPKEMQNLVQKAEEIMDVLQDILVPEVLKKLKEELMQLEVPLKQKEKLQEQLKNIEQKQEQQEKRENIEELFKLEQMLLELRKELKDIKWEEKKEVELIPPPVLKEKILIRIIIMPDYSEVFLGEEKQLIAVGEYDDGSQEDLTSLVQWSGADDIIASVSQGKVSTLSVGRIEVYAEYKELKSEPATVVVLAAKLVEIILTPKNSEITTKTGAW
ncbi:MAG: hypothetical protein NTW64_01260 [Candidatus Omnitrophica bacterium]|nr:hypothetical protein [Candidatus Omnitrophota bacterium]